VFLLVTMVSNGLNSVVLMYSVNFFNADKRDTFFWCLLRFCELWAKTSITCFTLNLFFEPENIFFLFFILAAFVIASSIWFVFFNDFKTESSSGSIFTFLMIFVKLVAVFSFKEINYGFDNIDTEA